LEEFQKQHIKDSPAASDINSQEGYPRAVDPGHDTDDYLMGSGDLISISVFEAQELNTQARITGQGVIRLPMLGSVHAEGLSTTQLEKKIVDILKTKYLHNPSVTVRVEEYKSNQVILVGAVNNPGTFDYSQKRRLLDVIAIAGGTNEKASTIAYITRKDRATKENKSYRIDLARLLRHGDMSQNIAIWGGDVIFIPEAGRCFIDGAVRSPGTYPLKGRITITEAIALAGGLAAWADDDSIKLIRYTGQGERKIVSLNYSDLHSGLGDTLILKDQDVIFAESSSSGKLFSGTGFSIGFLGTGVTYKDPQK